jgi:hypothetical protein
VEKSAALLAVGTVARGGQLLAPFGPRVNGGRLLDQAAVAVRVAESDRVQVAARVADVGSVGFDPGDQFVVVD